MANTEGVTLPNEHFLAVGNDEDGKGMLVVTSRLSSSFTVFTLNGHSVSSACGSHPSRCRELAVESITTSNFTSRHIVFIPLENGIQILELYHDGNLSLTTQHTLTFGLISNCSSLGAHKLGASYYLPCVSTENLFICELTLNTTVITQSTIWRCQQMLDIRPIGLMDISNMVPSKDVSASRQHLLVLLQNVLYRLYPVRNSNSRAYVPSQCGSVNLLLQSPKSDNKLLLYCRDHTSIIYNTDSDQFVNSGGLGNIQYPCSPSAEYIIHLTQNQMDFSYKLRSNGSDTVKIFMSPTLSDDFHSGVCIAGGNGHIFAYTDRSMGVFVFNATSENFTLLRNTQSCGDRNCELLLMYNNQYLVVRNRQEGKVSVYDLLKSQLIINLQNTTLQLVALIHEIVMVQPPTEPITVNTTSSPTDGFTGSSIQDVQSLSAAQLIAIFVPISLVIIISLIIAILVVIMVRKRR